jgi:uncharacterized membrane protein YcaP (DUF421 family)
VPEMFELTMPLWEIAARATIVYLAIILVVRLMPKRKTGHISPNDMLTLIVIGGMATDAIMGGSTSIGDILLLIGIVLAWGYVLDLMEFRVPALSRLLREPETVLVENGQLLRRNMRSEMVTEDELMSVLRKQGISDLSGVRSACLEADGEISVIGAGR